MRSPGGLRRTTTALGLAAAALTGCSGGDEPAVRVAEVGRATVTEVVEAPGTVTARATATVSSPAAGQVAVLRVDDGDRVEAGQVLLRIASPPAQQALEQAEQADRDAAAAGQITLPDLRPPDAGDPAALRPAEQAAERALAAARRAAQEIPVRPARAQALAAVRAAEAQYAAAQAQAAAARDQARAAVDRLDAGLTSLSQALSALGRTQRVQTRAALDAARATVDALVVRAPIGGVVSLGGPAEAGEGGGSGALDAVPQQLRGLAGSVLGGSGAAVSGAVEAGTPVRSGQVLATVTDVSGLSLTADVDETDVLLVREGQRATAELDALPGAVYGARVRTVDVTPTPSPRGGVAYGVRLSLGRGQTPDGATAPAPRPGMSAVVRLRVRTARDAVSVPPSAVVRDGARDAVWVVRDGVVARRTVRLGAQGERAVQVVDGLRVGERVVVSGADRVREGQAVP